MNSEHLAAKLDRLPRGARAGLLAVSIAAAFAVAGTGAHASPVKGPTAVLVGPEQSASDPVFEFKSATADEFECSLDGAGYSACTTPVVLHVNPGDHTFSVHAVDRAGVAGPAAEADWFTGPVATPTPVPTPAPTRAAGSR